MMIGRILRSVGLAVVAGIVGAAVLVLAANPPSTVQGAAHSVGLSPTVGSAQAASSVLLGDVSLPDVAERVVQGVVNISSTRVRKTVGADRSSPFFSDPFFRHFFGPQGGQRVPRERREQSLGSGVLVDTDGTILTNNHVVENADEIMVTLSDGRELEAKLVGTDPKSDVAVLRLEKPAKDLHPIPIGDSGELRLGEVVLAIGNPFGLGHTVTMGIVSAKGRANVGIVDYEDFIQTDAAINPGNSGGALVNLRGELVGVNTAILSRSGGYQGIGFAIPSGMARGVMKSLIAHGKVVRGWLGVMIQDVNKDLAAALDLETTEGVLVSDVVDGSPAAGAGLQRGDVIVALDGEKVRDSAHLRNRIAGQAAGSKVAVTYYRKGKKRTTNVKLGELPGDGELSKAKADIEEGTLDGLSLTDLNSETRKRYDVSADVKGGVVVQEVDHGSAAMLAGLRAGDVILEVNRQSTPNVATFEKLYAKAGKRILMLVYREGHTFFLAVRR